MNATVLPKKVINVTSSQPKLQFPPSLDTAVWTPAGFILGIIFTLVVCKCYKRNRREMTPQKREDSFYQENAVYWDHDLNGMVEFREHRITQAELLIANSRQREVQTDIDYSDMDRLLQRKNQTAVSGDPELDNLSLAPPPPLPGPHNDQIPLGTAPKPPRRGSKDDCVRQIPSYRKSRVPSSLQKTWILNSNDKLSASNNFVDFLDEAFSDQNSPLHQAGDHYTSVPSIVLIPNQEENPPSSHIVCRHSYINTKKLHDIKKLSESSSVEGSQMLVEYENTKIWMKSKESDVSDDETHVDCNDKQFQESLRNTLRRKESASHYSTDSHYSEFASLSCPVTNKPERPRTGYVVMELTDEVMSFLRVRENKQGKCLTSSRDILPENIYFDDRVKNGYLTMDETRH